VATEFRPWVLWEPDNRKVWIAKLATGCQLGLGQLGSRHIKQENAKGLMALAAVHDNRRRRNQVLVQLRWQGTLA